MFRSLTVCALIALAPAAHGDPAEDFSALVEAYEAHNEARNMVSRGRDGDLEAASRWTDMSPDALYRHDQAMAGFLERLEGINPADLPASDQASYSVLAYLLQTEAAIPAPRQALTPFTNDSGFHTTPNYVAMSTRLRTVPEAEAWIARIEALPTYFGQYQAWLERGIELGITQPREILDGVADQIEAQIVQPEDSTLFMPLAALPTSIGPDERERLEREALSAIENQAIPALEALHTFFEETYIPAARDSLGARDLPGGGAYYTDLVRQHTTLDLTPGEIHQRGIEEVARLRAEMETVIEEVGFEGSFAEFLDFLRTDPQFYAETEMELMMRASYLSKLADDAMPAIFNTLPRLPYGVRPVPAAIAPNYTTARYWPGDAENGEAGGYMVNTYRLDQRPLYELPALTLHEAVPGHHHQIALAQEMDNVPDFRRETYITAFGEGWGLYAEFLGYDINFYDDPYDRFGALTYEMWRACRLVADTGIHWYGWSREEAEACFLDNSALAPLNITNEVSRYISWPGQALAYKTGELLIRELRTEAETRLGADFELADFNDAVLRDGAVPLSFLEARMREWIEEQEASRED